jgi:hypothetical protein
MPLSKYEPTGKAVTRSFRIDTTWDEMIKKIAQEKGMSMSALLELVCRDYIVFYRWVEEFSSIIFNPGTILPVINCLEDKQLIELAEIAASTSFRESYLARGFTLDLSTVRFQIVDQMGRYAHWFKVIEHTGDDHYFYISHDYGPKWSTYVETFIRSLIENFSDLSVVSERVDNSIVIRLNNKPPRD